MKDNHNVSITKWMGDRISINFNDAERRDNVIVAWFDGGHTVISKYKSGYIVNFFIEDVKTPVGRVFLSKAAGKRLFRRMNKFIQTGVI